MLSSMLQRNMDPRSPPPPLPPPPPPLVKLPLMPPALLITNARATAEPSPSPITLTLVSSAPAFLSEKSLAIWIEPGGVVTMPVE